MNLKQNILSIFITFCCFNATAQVTFELTKFPKNNQLIPRNPATNLGTYTIVGTVARAANITSLRLKISKDSILDKSITVPVPTTSDKFLFNIPITIKAELKNYTVELLGLKNNQEIALAKADNVVSGDVFIINGQSNCIGRTEDIDHDKFMRSYTADFGWNDINYSSPSRWGGRMAKEIIDKERVPVAIFCEAAGGMRQTFYMRQAVNPYTDGNYGILYNRLKAAEVEKNVRALLWWQGESDGWETPLDSFKNQFQRLNSQWKEDYNAPVLFFQVRFRSCTHVNPAVFEAQRQLATDIPNVEILSSNPALSNDACHFFYSNGYDSIGNQAYRLLAAKLYNRSFTNTRPPNIVEAFYSGTNEITLKMKNIAGNLRVIGNPWADFKLEGCTAKITGGSAYDYRIKLNYVGDTTGLTGISYLCHIDAFRQDWIVNPLSVGILQFYNIPINKKQLTDTTLTPTRTEGGVFNISPTLVSDVLTVHFRGIEKAKKQFDIINAIGQIVLTKHVETLGDNAEINVSNLSKGLYFVRLSVDNQIVRNSQKFVK